MTTEPLMDNNKDGSIEEQIIRMSRLNNEPLPMLDLIFERFALSAASALKSYASTPVDLTVQELAYTTYADALEKLSKPALMGVVQARPWDGPLLLSMNSEFLFTALEILLGGSPSKNEIDKHRRFTSIERRLGQRLCEVMLSTLSQSFGQLSDVTFKVDRMDGNPESVAVSEPSELCIHVILDIAMNGKAGLISIIIPMATIESIRPLLSKVYFGEKLGADSGWQAHLTGSIEQSNITLWSILHGFNLPMNDVLAWKTGDTLELGIEADHHALVVCAGVPMFYGAMGKKSNGSVALRITEDLNGKEELTNDVISD